MQWNAIGNKNKINLCFENVFSSCAFGKNTENSVKYLDNIVLTGLPKKESNH